MVPGKKIRYRDAGVNIDEAGRAVAAIKKLAQRTFTPGVLTQIGTFGACYALTGWRKPVLVSSVDGVGTKLKIAFLTGRHDTIGRDLVNHCVNDIAVQGAVPLFFLDYLAVGKLDAEVAAGVISGIARACRENGCALIGGETAEMPGIYREREYDLAGFAVGVVNRDRLIDGSAITDGDVVIGLASSGLHSNGFSLVRKLIQDAGIALDIPTSGAAGDGSLSEELLTPTRIYSPTALSLSQEFPVHGMAHITGGGLTENVPRILHGRWDVELDLESWQAPSIFSWLARLGDLSDDDLFRTFNMGVGFVVVVPAEMAEGAIARASELGERAARIGIVRPGNGHVHRRGNWRDAHLRDMRP